MLQEWFVVRDGNERGPFSIQRLKQMAADGKLAPEDLIRRSDTQVPRKASSIKGLFPEPDEPTTPRTNRKEGGTKTKMSKKTITIIACAASGMLLFCCGGMGFLFVLGGKQEKAVREELAAADAVWDKGDKAGGATKYEKIVDDGNIRWLADADRPRLYGRLIDYKYEKGDPVAGKALIEKASKSGIMPAVTHSDARSVVAAIQADKDRVEAKQRLGKMTPVERLKEAKDDVIVDASTLFSDFDGNQVAANDKYKGKTIMVEGEVESVKSGGVLGSDRIYLSHQGLRSVQCSVKSGNEAELRKLRSGSWVRVSGSCRGKMFSGTVEMTDCVFVLVNR